MQWIVDGWVSKTVSSKSKVWPRPRTSQKWSCCWSSIIEATYPPISATSTVTLYFKIKTSVISTTRTGQLSPVRYAKFQSIRYFIDIDIFQILLVDNDIDINIFQKCRYSCSICQIPMYSIFYRYRYFAKSPYQYRYRYFSKVSISTIDISYRYIEQG